MNVIGFDTSTDDTVVAAQSGGRVTFETVLGPAENGRPVHSEELLSAVDEAATSLGGWAHVQRLAVGTGPGTFTGIRIAISTATGLALSTGLDLAGVSTLEALSRPMRKVSGPRSVLALIDARRGEVFGALYAADGAEIWEPFAASPEDLIIRLGELDRPPWVGGPGAVRFIEEFNRAGVEVDTTEAGLHRIDGPSICELGAVAVRAGQSNPLEPTYLRIPDARLWLQRDSDKNGS